ncbi:MAG: DUF4160 domain-containing protein [bacterium]
MKVLQVGKYAVYVYREIGGSHHLPHCHVRWSDGSVVVALPSLDVIAGGRLPRGAGELVADHLEEIWEAWNQLN